MKGCLKWQHSPSPSPGIEYTHSQKSVAFGAEICEQVYTADEWDRTPTEPARKLSYQDLLELKEIQRSLPHANQPADLLSGRAGSHYLSAVPINLLPLLAENNSSDSSSQNSSSTPSPVSSPCPGTLNWSHFPPPPTTRQAPAAQWHPPHLAHLLPAKPTPQRQKPRFAFLPLLDTPPSSPFPSNPSSRSPSPSLSLDLHSDTDQSLDPPTPSLDGSPASRASSCSPEPPSLRLPPPRTRTGGGDSYFPTFPSSASDERQQHQVPGLPGIHPAVAMTMATMRLHAVPSPNLVPPSPLSLGPPSSAPGLGGEMNMNIVPPKPRKKRNFIVVNDIEIELDDDDDEEEEEKKEEEEEPKLSMTPLPSSSSSSSSAAVVVAPVPEKPTTNHPPPSPSSGLPPSPTKPPLTTTTVSGSSPVSLPRPPPTANPKIKAASASPPASPNLTGTGALHAPMCFKRRDPSSASSSLSLCKSGSGSGGSPKSGGGGGSGSCKSGAGFSPSSSPLLVPSA
ncbi:hypothetical protein K443DRAFT_133768 [Laccaria amethystina LaAM-08-1]|uniref:Uncharacterized protein n=1 Tax=Laccaria amethystina LaAM-08-1 TaxID=1095629 RepID=A0A0C9WXZ6_9AGAR|nr:hypothetical protein K443DRAFT_133768 [Laccaria amethystina LaAM-08-1]